jgi:hypothetical protein
MSKYGCEFTIRCVESGVSFALAFPGLQQKLDIKKDRKGEA